MDKFRRDHLGKNYALRIFKNETWYANIHAALNLHKNMGQFRRLCNEYTNQLMAANGEVLVSKDFKFIEISLFEQVCGRPEIFQQPTAWEELRAEIRESLREDRAPSSIERTPYAEACKLKFTDSKESGMNKKVFEVKSYVFGQDVTTMSDDQLVAAIKTVEAEIDDLKGIKTKSKKIDARIKDLEAGLKSIVETLDGR